jgi:dipeptidase E
VVGHCVLLSSIDEELDEGLEEVIHKMIKGSGRKLGYVPSQYDETRQYYNKMKPNLDRFGFDEYVYVDIDKEFDERLLDELKRCNAIYMSGGNTYYFLNNLLKRGLIPFLRDFVEQGGILIGVSAGAMIMCRTIEAARFLDPNEIGLKDLNGLGRVAAHFLPHYDEQVHDGKEIRSELDGTIYVCKDGSGLIVDTTSTINSYGKIEKWQ